MEIEIVTRSVKRKLMLDLATKFLRKELKLEKSTYALTVYNAPGLRKREGFNGICSKMGEREITIIVDGGLGESELIQCIAHEMVHAKQIAKGQLQLDTKNRQLWLGQRVSKAYHERPWEQEAFARERILAYRALSYCEKEMGKRVKKLLKSV
jgi:hypothetical protein